MMNDSPNVLPRMKARGAISMISLSMSFRTLSAPITWIKASERGLK